LTKVLVVDDTPCELYFYTDHTQHQACTNLAIGFISRLTPFLVRQKVISIMSAIY